MNIAVDGPSATGKSTIAEMLAKKYNLIYLNTGNMYRAVALYFERKYGDFNEDIVNNEINYVNLSIDFKDGQQLTLLNGEIVDQYLRSETISMLASKISSSLSVRKKLVELQQEISEKYNIILDGRDIGTVVLPNADVKFFLTADNDTRAKRRWLELISKGVDADFDKIKNDLKKRDYNDSNRANSPLKMADDAILIDTSNLTIEQVVEECDKFVKLKVHHLHQ